MGSALWSQSHHLPSTCFISHAYADADVVRNLLAALPPHVTPLVFPPISVPPWEAVSTSLVESILECQGLIYLNGFASARSFWVAFERDYAKRSLQAVFSADPQTLKWKRDVTPPPPLNVYASYHHADRETVLEVVRHMADRHLQCFVDVSELTVGHQLQSQLTTALARYAATGYIVVFWSAKAAASRWVTYEMQSTARTLQHLNDRLLFARLDATPIPEFWQQFHDIDVQLFSDFDRSQKQRTDDLIVRLYWLIHRKRTRGEW